MTCHRCSEPTRKVPWSTYVECFDKGFDEGEWRARRARDVAEVSFRVHQWEADRASCAKALADYPLLSGSHATWRHEVALVDRHLATCQAWLTRARAALS